MTAYCATVVHEVDSDEEDQAGLVLMDLLDELTTPLIHAGSPASAETAKEEFNSTIMHILGITEALLAHLEVDPFDIIPVIIQANLRRG